MTTTETPTGPAIIRAESMLVGQSAKLTPGQVAYYTERANRLRATFGSTAPEVFYVNVMNRNGNVIGSVLFTF